MLGEKPRILIVAAADRGRADQREPLAAIEVGDRLGEGTLQSSRNEHRGRKRRPREAAYKAAYRHVCHGGRLPPRS
jgi:hypothetical protein